MVNGMQAKRNSYSPYKHLTIVHVAMDLFHIMQSCSKAWEYYGFVSEKDQAYKDAAFYYDKAWKHSNFSSPALGKCLLQYYVQVTPKDH